MSELTNFLLGSDELIANRRPITGGYLVKYNNYGYDGYCLFYWPDNAIKNARFDRLEDGDPVQVLCRKIYQQANAMIEIEERDGYYSVEYAGSRIDGAGPILYLVAMQEASKEGMGLGADYSGSTSSRARAVWQHFYNDSIKGSKVLRISLGGYNDDKDPLGYYYILKRDAVETAGPYERGKEFMQKIDQITGKNWDWDRVWTKVGGMIFNAVY
jgi:hypothetical protein